MLPDSIIEYFPFIFVFGIVAFIVGIIFLAIHLEKKRREKLQKIAMQLGFTFTAKPEENLATFAIAKKGHGHKVNNMLSGNKRGTKIEIFEYQYTTGYGKNRHVHTQTLFRIPLSKKTPSFVLAPENFFHKIGQKLGMRDINFPEDKAFSDTFVLKGEDEPAIRNFFSSSIRAAVRGAKVIESDGSALIFYTANRRLNPDDIPGALEKTFSMWNRIEAT